jgi:putative acetyltransferase
MSITISPIAESHVESFRECLDIVAREKKYIAQVEALPLEPFRRFVKQSIQSDAAQFVALEHASVVGWCDIFPGWAHAFQHVGSLGMGLLPEYRGRGVGQQLLAACIDKARSRGITRIELEARADNERAIRLYKRMGFVHEVRKARAMRFDGVYFDTVQMSLVFRDGA